MVGKIIRFFHKEINGLHQAAYLLAFFSLLSQLLGLLRDRLFAYTFGAGQELDIYYAAFRIPDFIFIVVASVVSVSVLIPFLSEREQAGHKSTKEFIDHAFTAFFVVIVGVSIVAYILMPKVVPLLFPGFHDAKSVSELIALSRILLLSPILLGCSNFFANITQLHNRFILTSISPLFYNGGIILGTLVLYPIWGLKGVAVGVVAGALFHWIIQIPFAIRKSLSPNIVYRIKGTLIAKPLLISLPRTLTLSSSQIVMIFFTAFASTLTSGSISVFILAMNLQSVPYGIIGGSYSSAVFPALSRMYAEKKMNDFLAQVIVTARHIIFWTMPVIALFIVLRAQIVRTILGAGQFSWSDTRLTAACLALFAISLVAQSLCLLFTRAFYAAGKTAKPVTSTLITATLTVIAGWYLVSGWGGAFGADILRVTSEWMKVSEVVGSSILLLALAFTIGKIIDLFILGYLFEKEFSGFWAGIVKMFAEVTGASLLIGFVTYAALQFFAPVFDQATGIGIFLQGFVSGVIGLVAGIGFLVLVNNKEIRVVWATIHTKIWRTRMGMVPEERVG